MGTYKNGISGPFSGKIGTVVGSTWKGINYMRSLPRPSKKEATDGQKDRRMRMALAIGFLSPLSGLFSVGFRSLAIEMTGFNVATSLLIREAISGVYPHLVIDYSKVLISIGTLTGAWNATASSPAKGTITLSWDNNTGSGLANPNDKAVLVVFNPNRSEYVFITDGAERNEAFQVLHVPENFSGDTVKVWIAFMSATENISTSIFAGDVLMV